MSLIVKTLILLSALGAVIWLGSQMRSDGFRRVLEGMFPPDSAWAWCPKNVQEVRLLNPERLIEDAGVRRQFCVVEMEPVEADLVKVAVFVPLLRVTGTDGSTIELETDAERGLFRVQGLPFRSSNLEKAVKAHSQP
ncbi:MAG: hypothetical protein KF802_08965 [Bdellovibrionaceae bacterium]|nr:hypothetical protein [Pseudobdellovibrionaceae bacterium]MBX3034170.1 hypothetical protein [Pseudobdellovibrionaceae bacterium]